MKTLVESYSKAKEEGILQKQDYGEHADLVRFKVQEFHQLIGFYKELNLIEFSENMNLNINKQIIHVNLVELNLNAFSETFELDKEKVKNLIGSLNWRKLNERIK